MRFPTILRIAAVGCTVLLGSCTNGVFSQPLYLAVTISPRPAGVPAGTSVTLTGTASNNLGVPIWSLPDASYTADSGKLTAVTGSPNSVLYTAPASPPLYSGSPGTPLTQGVVTIEATLNPPAQTTLPVAHDSISVFITTASVTLSSISPVTATVALGATQGFSAYELGSANNALTWQVNGVSGGSAATGTIAYNGVYTAPAAMPMAGKTVTITAIAQADPSKTATAVVTLQ